MLVVPVMRAKRRGGKRRSLGTPTPPVREDGDRNLEVPGEEKTEAEREGPVTSGRRGKKKVIPTLTGKRRGSSLVIFQREMS